jgi:monoamine oxidase
MARSPLFRVLRRIVRRAHHANRLGIQPGELGGAAPSGPSRRDVLRGTLGAAALVPLASACGDNLGNATGPSIAIVGGGIAGLSCAHFLGLAGLRAEIYEAAMRTGGRMYTSRGMLQGDQICELGGELIDTDHLVIPALAATFGLTLDDLPAGTYNLVQDVFHFKGAIVPEATIIAQFMPVAMKMDAAIMAGDANPTEFARIDNMSIPEWLASPVAMGGPALPLTSTIRQILEMAYLGEFGLEPSDQSAWNLITLIGTDTTDGFKVFGDSDEVYHLHQGSGALPDKISATLEDQIHLDHVLTAVAADGDRFVLTFQTSDGTVTVNADHVVYALPFTKLRQVDLTGAGLTAGKMKVINELGMGTNAKLMLQFDERAWENAPGLSNGSSITDVGELQATWATSRGQDGVQGVMTNFVGGGRGLSIGDGTAESQAQMALPWLETVFPGTQAHYIAGSAIRQHWPSYEFTKGSYASYLKGQWSFLGTEGAREGNQHFCGEHCSENFQGYMEGGAETGTMVAGEILDDLGVTQPPVLAGLISQITASPRASYHAGFGQRMRISQVRRG